MARYGSKTYKLISVSPFHLSSATLTSVLALMMMKLSLKKYSLLIKTDVSDLKIVIIDIVAQSAIINPSSEACQDKHTILLI